MENIIELIIRFYFLDWLGMIFSLLSLYYLGNKSVLGFVYGGIASLSWIGFGILTESVAAIIANLIFIYMNYRGYRSWIRDKNKTI